MSSLLVGRACTALPSCRLSSRPRSRARGGSCKAALDVANVVNGVDLSSAFSAAGDAFAGSPLKLGATLLISAGAARAFIYYRLQFMLASLLANNCPPSSKVVVSKWFVVQFGVAGLHKLTLKKARKYSIIFPEMMLYIYSINFAHILSTPSFVTGVWHWNGAYLDLLPRNHPLRVRHRPRLQAGPPDAGTILPSGPHTDRWHFATQIYRSVAFCPLALCSPLSDLRASCRLLAAWACP